MKISLNWLREFVHIPADIDPKKLAMLFTIRTAEIEGFESQAENFKNIVVGKILEIHPHPNADKLKITKMSIGSETLQIVCGDPAIYVGMYVPVALIGAKVHWHGEKEAIEMKASKIRGVESFGMACAGEEIGLEEKSDGVYDLTSLQPEIGKPLAEVIGKNDVIFTVDNKSLTHRPDLWGHYGIAREIAAIYKTKLKPPVPKVVFPDKGVTPNIQVKEPKFCLRYLGVLIENVKIEPSPAWLQNRLTAIGYRPINNIVDATNYVMAELGQPLHAFDLRKIEKGIVVRMAEEDEKITTLDGITRKLSTEMLVIADHKKALAVAGIMGSADAEIDASTANILVESATFNPSSVRKTSVTLGLRTEALQRFEKSLDPHLAALAMDRVCELILELCPSAKISAPKTDIKHFEDKNSAVEVDLRKVFSKIGMEIPLDEVLALLESLEFQAEKIAEHKLKIKIPSFRATKDISIEDDLVEEIARLHGYENIEPKLPELPIKLPVTNTERMLKHQARQIFAQGLGFSEVYNYSFYSLSDIKNALLPEEPHLTLKNHLSEDQTHLRISLLPNILKNIHHNLKFFENFKLFEIGRTYEDLQEYFPLEEKKICAVIVKNKRGSGQKNSTFTQDDFYEAKGVLETFFQVFRVAGLEMRKGETFCPYAHPQKYIEYVSKKSGEIIARVFELHPMVAKNFDLEHANITGIEINFTKLVLLGQRDIKYRPIPKFPGIEFDISVLVDKKAEIGSLEKLIRDTDKTLIAGVELFDLYEGANIPSDRKALAFKISLQAKDRTLTDEDMKNIQLKIFSELQKAGGEIRGLGIVKTL